MTGPADVLVDRLVSNLAFGRIRSVAFVVPSDVSCTRALYDVAIATARRGWRLGTGEARYVFVTPEPEPVSDAASAGLEPEGITFIGSTYPDVQKRVVWLDPQGESLEADVIVSIDPSGELAVTNPLHVDLGDAVPPARARISRSPGGASARSAPG